MTNLATHYLGLPLKHPIVASASALTATCDGMRRLEDAGAAAVVMASLYEEEIRAADAAYAVFTEETAGMHAEAASYFPHLPGYRHGVAGHLETLRRATQSLRIPVIASLNCFSTEGWIDYGVELQEAGAAALELSFDRLPNDFGQTGREVEEGVLDVVRRVRARVGIPLSVKLLPFFSALGNFVEELEESGVDGLGLFNRYVRLDFDLDTLSVETESPLSRATDIHLPLAWTALLSRRVKLSLAAGGGVDSHVEVVKLLLAGADVVTTASSLLRHGPGHMTALVEGLERWIEDNGFASVSEVRGRLGAAHLDHAGGFFRNQSPQAYVARRSAAPAN